MTPDAALAERLTARIVAVEGVRGLFPSHTVAAAVLAVFASAPGVTAFVDVSTRDGVLRVSARLATDRRVPSAEVIAGVTRVVTDLAETRPFALQIELAHVD